MKYKWNCVGFSANANKVGKEIETINKSGELNRENILEYAKNNKESEIYKCFEWDDKIAGEKYRLNQATMILNSISIVIKKEQPPKPIRAFVNVRNSDDNKIYKSIIEVLENDEEYEQLLRKAEREFKNYKEKYSEIIRLKDLKNIINENI